MIVIGAVAVLALAWAVITFGLPVLIGVAIVLFFGFLALLWGGGLHS